MNSRKLTSVCSQFSTHNLSVFSHYSS